MSKPSPASPLLRRLVSLEGFIVQVILYLLLWLVDTYMAKVVSLILGGIALALYLLSHLIELVDRSRVPKVYYRFMLWCFLAPLLGGLIGYFLSGGG